MSRTKTADWVVSGGKTNESGHCMRCGEGLVLTLPMDLADFAAALRAFADRHRRCKHGQWQEPFPSTPQEWSQSRDVGISSFTIYQVMTGSPSPYKQHDPPKDPEDFGRCYRLLALFPEWRLNLHKVADLFPAWKPLVTNWMELSFLYGCAIAGKTDGSRLYARIQELLTPESKGINA